MLTQIYAVRRKYVVHTAANTCPSHSTFFCSTHTDANICRADIPFFNVQILTQMYVVWLLFFFYVDKVSVEASKWETVNQRVTDLSGELKSIRSRINAL